MCPCGKRAYTYYTGGYACESCFKKDQTYFKMGLKKDLIKHTRNNNGKEKGPDPVIESYRCALFS